MLLAAKRETRKEKETEREKNRSTKGKKDRSHPWFPPKKRKRKKREAEEDLWHLTHTFGLPRKKRGIFTGDSFSFLLFSGFSFFFYGDIWGRHVTWGGGWRSKVFLPFYEFKAQWPLWSLPPPLSAIWWQFHSYNQCRTVPNSALKNNETRLDFPRKITKCYYCKSPVRAWIIQRQRGLFLSKLFLLETIAIKRKISTGRKFGWEGVGKFENFGDT